MDDLQIIAMYNARNEAAVHETAVKYGRLLYRIANSILSIHEDSEEVVNDTYGKAWDNIPPQRPNILSAYLGRITRNLSFNRWHKQTAKKRGNRMDLLLSELNECVPSPSETLDTVIEAKELTRAIDRWLSTLPSDDRILFLRRYWFGDMAAALAAECSTTPNKLAGRLYRLRQNLKKALEMEGIVL